MSKKCQLFDFLLLIKYDLLGPSEIGGLMLLDEFPLGKLSPHFTFEELTKTSKTSYKLLNTLLAKQYIKNMLMLTNYLLEPVRVILNMPLIITSGYRCPALNKEVGGSGTSQHLNATAADFIIDNKKMSLEQAFAKLTESSVLHYGQLILEKSWIHISLGVPFRDFKKCYESFKIL